MAKVTKNKKAGTKSSSASKSSKSTKPGNTDPALLELFIDEIKDIYWAEKHLTKALPKMQKSVTSQELGKAIGKHLELTKTHVRRLEQVFEMLEHKAQAKKCDAMEGLIKEGEGVIEETKDGTATRDVGIILACQKVEHYEIATYGGLTQLAKTLELTEIADLLGQTLGEEKEADETLTGIAENDINYEAAEED